MTMKTCNKCYERKDLSEFYKNPKTKDGRAPKCKVCHKAYSIAYMKADPARTKIYKNQSNKNIRARMTVAERAAEACVNGAKWRSDMAPTDLCGGLSHKEACVMTEVFVKERLRLEADTGVAHHIDHIISIAAGGTHTADNLQVLTAAENFKKGATE